MKGRASFGRAAVAAWVPSEADLKRSRLAKAMKRWGYSDIATLHRESIDKPDWFWRAALDDLGVEFSQDWTQFQDASEGHAFPRWFIGGKINAAYNCCERHAKNPTSANRMAVTSEADSGVIKALSYAQLHAEVERIAAGLVSLGITKGDRVGLFLPVLPEAAVALLACAKIGAIGVPAFSGYGPEPLAARLNAAGVSVLVTVDGTSRRGKRVPMKDIVDQALVSAPSVRHVLMIRNDQSEVAHIEGRDHDWAALGQGLAPVATEAMDPNDPMLIIFTSGTTGAPKGIVHSHAGYLVKSGLDFGYGFDIQGDDRLGWIADMGWMLGPLMIIGAMQFGAGIVFVEGLPNFPQEDRMWRIVERHKVTILGMAPTAVRGLRALAGDTAPRQDLSSLRAVTSTGEAWDHPTWHWMFETICKKRLPILNYTGGTETGGGILSNYTMLPISPASFAGPLLGQDVDVLDQDGNQTNDIGELCVQNTWPGMTHAFWGDKDRYFATYWDRWENTWVHGDLASIDADGYWHIHGRSDDTIKVAGRRVGPAEIESAIVTHPQVAEAAVIGVPHPDKGSVIVAFATLKADAGAFDQKGAEAAVTKLVGKAMVPSTLIVVEGLPKTKNGKIMRRAIRARYLGQPAGDMSALDAATPLDMIPVLNPTEEK